MSERLYVGSRKGLFELARTAAGWDIADSHFMGDPVSAIYALGDTVIAALDLGHFGAKLWRRDGNGEWREIGMPAFPQRPADAGDDPHPWTVGKIWNLTSGGIDGRIWAGTMPGGLFRSDDCGDTWSLVDAFWTMPERRRWFGVAGGEMPGISSVHVDSADPDEIRVGISCGGVWASHDGGASWRQAGRGFLNEYMPPDQQGDPIAQDIHQLAHCSAKPSVMWCQHHSGVYRSEDQGENWTELTAATPSRFGFAVVAHPRDPDTAWFVPAIKDEKRYPVDAALVVSRTRDGGKTFEVLRDGLPQRHVYDLVYRHAMAIDETGDGLAFGSTSGGLWTSGDGGDTWSGINARLPPIACVRFAA
ncbi:MAG: hypothetical protein RIC16_04845 [Rhodospirillales bacterium]